MDTARGDRQVGRYGPGRAGLSAGVATRPNAATWSRLFAAPLSHEQWSRGARVTDEQRVANYARWFILMRWFVVLVSATLIVIGGPVIDVLQAGVVLPLMAAVAALALCNAGFLLLTRHDIAGNHLLLLQASADLVILTVVLHFSGGIENPLTILMLIHAIVGGIILTRRRCYAVAALAGLLFALLAAGECAGLLEHHPLRFGPEKPGEVALPLAVHDPVYVGVRVAVQTAVLFLATALVTTVTVHMRRGERQLERMADAALAHHQLLERSLETTGTGLRILHEHLRVSWANRQWNNWFSGPAGDGPAGGRMDAVNAAARRTFDDGQVRIVELDIPVAGAGSSLVYQVATAPLFDSDRDVTQVVQLAQDITRQKQSYTQMMRAEQLAALGRLAGQVAHEVNNPVAIINAKSRLLLSKHGDELTAKTAQELEKIIDLSDRVAGMVRALLSSSRPSGATRTALDVRAPIRKVLPMIEQRAAGCRIVDGLTDEMPPIRANSQELEQLFLNLFLNALDAMPGGGTLTVSASSGRARLSDGRVCVEVVVADTGAGIPEETLPYIFEPFFTTKDESRGTGLGLWISQGLVHDHGGEIDVDSEVGCGTRFRIRFPVEPRSEASGDGNGEGPDPDRR